MKTFKRAMSIYTEQEKDFLESVLSLLKITFKNRGGDLGSYVYEFFCTENELRAVLTMLKANYDKNFA